MKKVLLGCVGGGCLVVLGVLVVLFIIGHNATGRAGEETAIVTGEFRAQSMDFDRKANAVYLVEQKQSEPEGEDLLVRLDLATGQKEVLYNARESSLEWVSVSRRGTVFLLDGGTKPLRTLRSEAPMEPRILELEGARVVRSIPVLTEAKLKQQGGRETSQGDSAAAGCAAAIAGATTQTPLGIQPIDFIPTAAAPDGAKRREVLRKTTDILFLPRFLVLGSAQRAEVAVQAQDCGFEAFQRFHEQLFDQNLSTINDAVIRVTETARPDQTTFFIDSERDFMFRSVREWDPLSSLKNSSCEKQHDEVAWGRYERVNMGKCAHGVLGFPESYHAFTAEGDFLYRRWAGVFTLSRYHRRSYRGGSPAGTTSPTN
jgi:hypothetical protein